MSDHYAHVQQMTKMLKNLRAWLDKGVDYAQRKKFDPSVLLQGRLQPDMFPLVRQIQSACDGAKFLAARGSGKDAPKHPDTETTIEEAYARIDSVLAYLGGFSAADFTGADERIAPLGFMPGKGLAMGDFVREMNLPNTYFHLTMAYAILRHNGVELGKTDFLGSLNLRDL